jgi:hypothetical protein
METFKQISTMKSSKNKRANNRDHSTTTTRDRVVVCKSIIAIDKTTATNKMLLEVATTMEAIRRVKANVVAIPNTINPMESSNKI